MKKPKSHEHSAYYSTYINLVEGDILEALQQTKIDYSAYLNSLENHRLDYRYAKGKWSIAELIQHLIDTERVMCYRAMCIARGDQTSFPGFDQDLYVEKASVSHKSISQLLEEYELQRASTLALFQSFTEEEFQRMGIASDSPISVRALAYIIAGHDMHHLKVLKECY